MPEGQEPEITSSPGGSETPPTGLKWSELKAKIESEPIAPLVEAKSEEDSLTVTVESASPASEDSEEPAEEWVDPEGWDQHYYPKDRTKLREVLRSDPEAFRDVFGNPITDSDHPFHKPFADTQREFRETRKRVLELEGLVAGLPPPQSVADDDPSIQKYGGITAQDVADDYSLFPNYEQAKSNYVQRSAIIREQSRIRETEKAALEAEEAEFRSRFPSEDPKVVYDEFSPFDTDGKPNVAFRPITLLDARDLQLVRRAGSLENYVEARVKQALKDAVPKAKSEAIKEIAQIRRVPHLTSSDQEGEVTVPQFKAPRNANEVEEFRRRDPKGYERWASQMPWLKKRA